jgi:AAA domain
VQLPITAAARVVVSSVLFDGGGIDRVGEPGGVFIFMVHSVYMVIGCPGSGKSWVCEQLKDQFHCVQRDPFSGMSGSAYIDEIVRQSRVAIKPLLIEAPFSISKIKEPLERLGFRVTPVFIQENYSVIRARYRQREGREIPRRHLTRQHTYQQRAIAWDAFQGTSSEVLRWLNDQL